MYSDKAFFFIIRAIFVTDYIPYIYNSIFNKRKIIVNVLHTDYCC